MDESLGTPPTSAKAHLDGAYPWGYGVWGSRFARRLQARDIERASELALHLEE